MFFETWRKQRLVASRLALLETDLAWIPPDAKAFARSPKAIAHYESQVGWLTCDYIYSGKRREEALMELMVMGVGVVRHDPPGAARDGTPDAVPRRGVGPHAPPARVRPGYEPE